jgi:(1->4)-alpha-D-glucan 1-alpha-D-glucosylmutase
LLSELLRASDSPGRRALLDDLLHTMLDGRIKLFVTAIALRYRRERARVFLAGTYHPLRAFGNRERHLFGFARAADGETVIAAVPRMVASIFPAEPGSSGPSIWGDTGLEFPVARPGSAYRNLFTGETVHPVAVDGRPACAASDLFATFPVALLERLP